MDCSFDCLSVPSRLNACSSKKNRTCSPEVRKYSSVVRFCSCVEKMEIRPEGSNSRTSVSARSRRRSRSFGSTKSLRTKKPSLLNCSSCSGGITSERVAYRHWFERRLTLRSFRFTLSALLFAKVGALYCKTWSRLPELNRRPSNYESDALPTELSRLRLERQRDRETFCTIRTASLRCQAREIDLRWVHFGLFSAQPQRCLRFCGGHESPQTFKKRGCGALLLPGFSSVWTAL